VRRCETQLRCPVNSAGASKDAHTDRSNRCPTPVRIPVGISTATVHAITDEPEKPADDAGKPTKNSNEAKHIAWLPARIGSSNPYAATDGKFRPGKTSRASDPRGNRPDGSRPGYARLAPPTFRPTAERLVYRSRPVIPPTRSDLVQQKPHLADRNSPGLAAAPAYWATQIKSAPSSHRAPHCSSSADASNTKNPKRRSVSLPLTALLIAHVRAVHPPYRGCYRIIVE